MPSSTIHNCCRLPQKSEVQCHDDVAVLTVGPAIQAVINESSKRPRLGSIRYETLAVTASQYEKRKMYCSHNHENSSVKLTPVTFILLQFPDANPITWIAIY
jgi:hypothetical protein